jgi:hypothetical protein
MNENLSELINYSNSKWKSFKFCCLQCVVEFGAEALTSLPAQLTIAQLDPFQPQNNKTLDVAEGNTVAITCDAPYSNPPPVIQFYKDRTPLEAETSMLFYKIIVYQLRS